MPISSKLASCPFRLNHKNTKLYLIAALAVIFVALPLTGGLYLSSTSASEAAPATTGSRLSMPGLEGEKAIDHLKQQGLYDSLGEAMRAARYSINPVERPDRLGLEPGSHYANNPTQQYQAIFTPADVEIVPSGGKREWHTGMKLNGYGYGQRLRPAGKAEMRATTARVEYHREATNGLHSGIVEWYVNRAEGVEQGFTLATPPMEKREGERLVVALDLKGSLRAKVKTEGQSVTLSKRDGTQVLSYEKLVAVDATGRELAARMSLRGDQVLLEVDDAGAVYPVEIDPTFSQQQKLTAIDGAAHDGFGNSVAIDGVTVVVGAPSNDEGGVDAGAAYVFLRTGSTWTLQQKLIASDVTGRDSFGWSVAISGESLVVGAPLKDLIGKGAAYVFVRAGTTWTEQQKLTASDRANSDNFGHSVAIDGETVIAGAFNDDNEGGVNAGAAYVFLRTGTVWTEQQKLTASDADASDEFGWSVAIDGETAVIGSRLNDNEGGLNAGAAYVFIRAGTIWTEQQKLTASDAVGGDEFGFSVAVSGETVVVGTPINDNEGGELAGAAYVFVRTGTVWTEQQKLTAIDAAGGSFGNSVAIDGEIIVVGAVNDDNAGGENAGAAHVFVRTGTTWAGQQKLTASDAHPGDRFGNSVAVDGETIVVGAPAGDNEASTDEGAAYVFVRNSGPVCELTCPDDISQSNDPGQCGANVTFTAPMGDASCGQVTCRDPQMNVVESGSFFPVGSTLVTCTSESGQSCSFTVTVNDTEAPAILCPANVIAVAAPSCPPATGAVVTFADPQTSDLCVMESIMCSPPSGSTFPVGTSTVTCMASDEAGNKTSCMFTVTVFNGCLQDDSNRGNQALFNTFTGEYIFCCNGAVLATGTGTLTKQGCTYTIQHNTATRRALIKVDFTVKKGNASIQMPPGSLKCTITDRDIRDNLCDCAGGPRG